MRNISALTGEGVDELMEMLVLETELLELKANPKKSARGAVVESEITRGMGPVAWVLVKSGTLKVGDVFLAGETYGRVRAMHDSHGNSVEETGPSTAVVVQGFNRPATAGDTFIVVKDERIARSIADQRAHQAKLKSGPAVQHVTLEDFHAQLMAGERSELNVLVKADVQGSVDVLQTTLREQGNEEVRVNLVHTGVGAINESDVLLASASDAVILGFGVEATPKAGRLAEDEGVAIRTYRVIYELVEDVRKSLEGLLTPESREVVLGHAEIRQVFKASALGSIAGCMQTDGEIKRDSLVRVLRDGDVIHEGRVGSLRRDKDTVPKVQAGFECGIKVEGFDDIREGDIIEAYEMEEVAKVLA
jgi:translation initiation factor IF-2